MLNPQEDEYMIDTAAGSSGFPVHTIFHVWWQILDDEGLEASHLATIWINEQLEDLGVKIS